MTPTVPPQFDGQSSWFEYEDLIDDWLGITTLDANKHGPSLKNALVGAVSFYKSEIRIVASPILRTHWDPTSWRSKSCVSLAILPVVSHLPRPAWIRALDRTFPDCTEETPCIVGRLIDLTDLPDVGTAEFLAAFTDAQREHYQQVTNDEERMNYQVTLREQTITNRRAQHQNAFPPSDNLMSLFLS